MARRVLGKLSMASIQACLARAALADDQVILYFPQGLPGFEYVRRCVVAERAELAPLVCLESVDTPQLRLWVAPVSAIDLCYSLEVSREDLNTLGLDERTRPVPGKPPVPENDVLCLAILCSGPEGQLSANLAAPIVVNVRTHVALQAVRADTRYSHRHPVAAPAIISPAVTSPAVISPAVISPAVISPAVISEERC